MDYIKTDCLGQVECHGNRCQVTARKEGNYNLNV